MSLSLHTIAPAKGAKKDAKKIGRGGKRGTYSGKGIKGQKSRSGVSGLKRLGMKQLIEQTPKLRGFKSLRPKLEVVNVSDLNDKFKDGEAVNPESLVKTGLVSKPQKGIKILGNGEISIKVEVEGCTFSKSAQEKIEKAGGKVK